jgi:hypothetical protein
MAALPRGSAGRRSRERIGRARRNSFFFGNQGPRPPQSSATIGFLKMSPDNLISLKDDMVAFIEGHGMRRLPGYVTEDLPTVLWEDDINPDSWKDFVEMAKFAGAPFITMSAVILEKEDVQLLLEQIRDENYPDEDAAELEEAQYLVNFVGKVGYIQLGFAYQGVIFVHENATQWYERYQQLVESVEDLGDIVFEDDADEEQG